MIEKLSDLRFAVFVITRNRPSVLKDTIGKFRLQTLQPSTILVVDNSDNDFTESMVIGLSDTNIQYYKTGFNSGPAGAAKIAMQLLFNQGYDRVVWGDDDDPPVFNDALNNLIQLSQLFELHSNIGMIGAVGAKFNGQKGKMIRFPDFALKGLLEVDSVSGGMLPVIHRKVFDAGIKPDSRLFFGFEELDFCLAIRRAGLKIIVSGEEMYRYRANAGRLNLEKKPYYIKPADHLWREYYSVRNLLYILLRKEKTILGALAFVSKSVVKSAWGFRYGFLYGYKNFYYISTGIIDGLTGKLGMGVMPVQKQR